MEQDDPKLREILDTAADLPAERRAAFLDQACEGDGKLRFEVESLLGALLEAQGFLAAPTVGDETAAAHDGPEKSIGPYKLLQKIGEGGMGVVYMAEQERPVVRRVAIKIIKLGMDTRQVIARFEAERQALALMDHPNIARVLDAGATDTGRPYFVMELVRGISITEYCDSNNLSTRERLELFLPVCRAVQHAHQKGIIHRDIKPSNVLITMHDGVPVPKVIDFGIAKATSGRLTDKTLFTEYHQFVGTPEYMSPEQAEMSGLDIDTRADVYALGVLLYELLTGSTPFDGKSLRSAAYAEIQRIIREVEPPKPSTRLSTLGETLTKVAAHRAIDPRKLGALMRGDLDWIVMKCLEKDRTRRYETANELGAEVQRHLNNETVLARPTSAAYRVRKFVRRHRVGVAAAAALALTLVLGIIGTTYGLLRAKNETAHAKKETERATREADKAKAVTEFVQRMLASANPMRTSRNDITVREIIDEAARKVDSGSFQAQPEVEAGIRQTLGVSYRGLGRSDQAEAQLRKSLALVEKVYGPQSPEAAVSLRSLAHSLRDDRESIELLRRSLKIARDHFANDSAELAAALDALGMRLHMRDSVAAEPYLREALRIRRATHDDMAAAATLTNLGNMFRATRQFEESLAAHREALDLYRKYKEENSWEVSYGWLGVANTLLCKGDFEACDEPMTRAMDIRRKILTVNHPTMRASLIWLSDVRRRIRHYGPAADLLLEVHKSLMGLDNNDPQSELYEPAVTERLARIYYSSGNQQETEHWRGIWLGLMQARVAKLSEQIAAEKEDAALLCSRAEAYYSLGELEKASLDMAAAIRIDPFGNQLAHDEVFAAKAFVDPYRYLLKEAEKSATDSNPRAWFAQSCLLAYLGHADAYKQNSRSMLDRFANHPTRWVRQWVAEGCLLSPQSPVELKQIADVVDKATPRATDDFVQWHQTVKGLAEYRLGHFEQAIDWSTKSRDGNYELEEKIESELVIAMASYKLGRLDLAQAALAQAADQIDKDMPHLGISDIDESGQTSTFAVNGWLICQILLREAKDLIRATPTPA